MDTLGSPNSADGRRQRRQRRTRGLVEYLDAEITRIAEVESRPRAEVERLLLLAGVRGYNAGVRLRFRETDRPDSMLNASQRRQLAQGVVDEAAVAGERPALRLVTEEEGVA